MERDFIRWSKRGAFYAMSDNGNETEIRLIGKVISVNPKLSNDEKHRLAALLDGMPVTEDALSDCLKLMEEVKAYPPTTNRRPYA